VPEATVPGPKAGSDPPPQGGPSPACGGGPGRRPRTFPGRHGPETHRRRVSARASPETWGILARGAPRPELRDLRVTLGFSLRFNWFRSTYREVSGLPTTPGLAPGGQSNNL